MVPLDVYFYIELHFTGLGRLFDVICFFFNHKTDLMRPTFSHGWNEIKMEGVLIMKRKWRKMVEFHRNVPSAWELDRFFLGGGDFWVEHYLKIRSGRDLYWSIKNLKLGRFWSRFFSVKKILTRKLFSRLWHLLHRFQFQTFPSEQRIPTKINSAPLNLHQSKNWNVAGGFNTVKLVFNVK